MDFEEKPRLARLTQIITILQSKNLTTAPQLAKKFDVSIRTIYRDIRTLERSGIPIFTVEGKGYSLMSGYNMPPVMFTQEEANALLTAEKIIRNNSDASLIKHYSNAITKIRSVLKKESKEGAETLEQRTAVLTNMFKAKTSNYLSDLQNALIKRQRLKLTYTAIHNETTTERNIDILGIYNTSEKWLTIAFCHKRQAIREFRLDRFESVYPTGQTFEPYSFDLKDYFMSQRNKG